MCFSIPYKINKIKGQWAWIDCDRKVSLTLVPQAKINDWLLVHANLAVNVLNKKEAQEILNLTKSCHHD